VLDRNAADALGFGGARRVGRFRFEQALQNSTGVVRLLRRNHRVDDAIAALIYLGDDLVYIVIHTDGLLLMLAGNSQNRPYNSRFGGRDKSRPYIVSYMNVNCRGQTVADPLP